MNDFNNQNHMWLFLIIFEDIKLGCYGLGFLEIAEVFCFGRNYKSSFLVMLIINITGLSRHREKQGFKYQYLHVPTIAYYNIKTPPTIQA